MNQRTAAWLGLALGVACASCGGVQTAGLGGPANDVFLVEVTDVVPSGGLRLVSVSSREVVPDGNPPARPSDGDVEAMRRGAAAHGAQVLVLERVHNRWRHAFYGLGYVRTDVEAAAPLATCSHPGAVSAHSDAQRRADRCLQALHAKRPALKGRIEVAFQVDAHGAVYRAAATPASSRDTQLQRCAMDAIHAAAGYGAHRGVLCAMSLQSSLFTR